MCDEPQPNAVVPDVNIGVVAGRLCQLCHVVDEAHGGDEVLEGSFLNEFTVLKGPVWKCAKSLLDFLIRQFLHGFSFPVSSGRGLACLSRGDPALLGHLAAAAEGESIGRDVFGDAGAGGDVGTVADGDGSDEGGVRADEGAVADGGEVFVDAVVVAGDGARADVDAGADDGVAEVGEVVGLGAFAERDLLGFDEVADVGAVADVAFGAEVGVGAEDGAVGDVGVVEDAAVADGDAVAEWRSSG